MIARVGLMGITLVALVCFALYAAVMASRVDEIGVGEPVPISIPGVSGVSSGATTPFGVGLRAPDFELETVNGQRVKLSDFAGRPVWINIWASWCAPCRAEMPEIEQVYRESRVVDAQGADTGPVVLLISLGEDPAVVRRYLESTRYDLPFLLDPDFAITDGYRITGLPTHFFVDRSGTIRDLAIGGLKPNGMRARLAKISG
ncbi:MAG: TlpA family protein disulfide reductase [Chloroflexota bacterium]|nr:TlpA family protein disulfide reductase [Chloroflexota bacterium]